jgi:hypothetical protein
LQHAFDSLLQQQQQQQQPKHSGSRQPMCRLTTLICCCCCQGIDNPDQRLSQDLPLLTRSLADTLAILAAVPFNIAWYTQLTHQVRRS